MAYAMVIDSSLNTNYIAKITLSGTTTTSYSYNLNGYIDFNNN